jgi:DNA repair exonuclease SbcCD ATPase subunit
VEKRKVLLEDKERCRKWIEASDRLPVANEARERAERLLERLNGLTRLRERGKELAREKDDITHNLARLEHVREAQERFRRLEKWPDRLKKLEGLGRKWMNLRKGRAEAAAFMERYREIPILTQTVVRLEQQAERLKQLKKLRESLVDTRDRICRGRELCEEREAQIKQLVAEWATLLQQLGKCPTCGSRIDASVIDHIMEEVRGGLERAAVGRENQEDPPTA